MPGSVWRDEFYVMAYRLRRDGMEAKANLAHALGCSATTLANWFRDRPALELAWEQGALDRGGGGAGRAREYIYQRLPQKLKDVWDELERLVNDPCGVRRIEEIFAEGGKRMRMHIFVHALCVGSFNPSIACRFVGISKRTLDEWKQDPDFAELMDEVIWHKKNFYEGALDQLVAAGEPAAVIFANRSINADRGFTTKTTVALEHSGTVNHRHAVITLEMLEPYLDIETKQRLLAATRAHLAATQTPALPGTVVAARAEPPGEEAA